MFLQSYIRYLKNHLFYIHILVCEVKSDQYTIIVDKSHVNEENVSSESIVQDVIRTQKNRPIALSTEFSFDILRVSSKSTRRKLNYLGISNLKLSPPVAFDLDELNDYFTSVVPKPCPDVKEDILRRFLAELADTT